MNFYVPCRDAQGNPRCPICEAPVEQAGALCSKECYTHFLMAVVQQPGIVEMEDPLLDLDEMPWHTEDSQA